MAGRSGHVAQGVEVRAVTTVTIFVLTAIIFVLSFLNESLRRELRELYKECESMFHRDRKTGRMAKGLRRWRD